VRILTLPLILTWLSACKPLAPALSPTQSSTPAPRLLPTDTVVPTPTLLPPTDPPTLTVTPQPADETQATAWVSLARPGWGSVQTVFARLTRAGQGVAQAQMYSVVHDADADRRWPEEGFEVTGDDGTASVSFVVVDAPEGFIVHLDVYLVYEGSTYHTRTAFAPQC